MDPVPPEAAWQLVFNGECLDGHDPQTVRRAVAGALKLDAKRAARLFSGKRVVLLRKVDVVMANRYIARFAQMGALLRAEASNPPAPRTAPAPTSAARIGRARARWQRPALWAGITGLCIAVGLVLGSRLSVLRPETRVADAPAKATQAADDEIPQDMTADAVSEFKLRYTGAPDHKAFAISSGGSHAWHAGAASENEARERAVSQCIRLLRPGDDGCRVVHADANWQE